MASRFHKSRMRRAEREPITAHGSLNLVPLVDVLTSVVFFSLLTYTGAAVAALSAFDLSLPPVMVTAEQARASAPEREQLNLMLAVKITGAGLRVEHSGDGGFMREIAGRSGPALEQLQSLMREIRQRYPQNDDVLVVPDDAISYDDVIKVLERIKMAQYRNVALGSRARATQVAAAERGGR